jgi:hypothetical protein
MEEERQALLTAAVAVGKQFHQPTYYPAGRGLQYPLTVSCVGPNFGLGASQTSEISCLSRKTNNDSSVVADVTHFGNYNELLHKQSI